MAEPERLFGELESKVEALGFELVELQRAGDARRPILRLRIDRPGDGAEDSQISLDDCARVSRALEASLDENPRISERYVLEVSSPGVERPLVRPRDWRRFAGREARIRGREVLAGRSRTLDGTILGLADEAGAEAAELRLADDEVVRIPLAEIREANLIFRWGSRGRSGRDAGSS
jgi:ribosome maturation factor RimP